MKIRDYRDYLQDISDSIDDVGNFTKDMTFEKFAKDRKTINAIIRSIEVIGEATKKLPTSVKDKHPSIPWKRMAGMRDKMIHEYFGIDVEILWKVVKEDIPSLKTSIQNALKMANKLYES